MLDLELNRLTKALFLAQVVLSVVMVALQGFLGPWFRNLFRFVVLFSYIIPIRYVYYYHPDHTNVKILQQNHQQCEMRRTNIF